jgi:hypothetical protein
MGWVIVEFPDTREVLIDDKPQGPNRWPNGELRTIIIDDGDHTFCLGPPPDCAPPSHTLFVEKTSVLMPLRVVFTKV